jgi:hypothetical protein
MFVSKFNAESRDARAQKARLTKDAEKGIEGGNKKRKERQEKLFVPAALCALASLR